MTRGKVEPAGLRLFGEPAVAQPGFVVGGAGPEQPAHAALARAVEAGDAEFVRDAVERGLQGRGGHWRLPFRAPKLR
jgi:hypothetical protein